jgi:hypothetical protein
MERARLNYWIDVVLLVAFIIVTVSGFVLKFAFVSAQPGVGRGILFLGTSKIAWLPWHTLSGIAMTVLVFVHLVLHFNWIKVMTKTLFKSKV